MTLKKDGFVGTRITQVRRRVSRCLIGISRSNRAEMAAEATIQTRTSTSVVKNNTPGRCIRDTCILFATTGSGTQ